MGVTHPKESSAMFKKVIKTVSLKKSVFLLLVVSTVYISTSSFKNNTVVHSPAADSILSKKAFMQVYAVLMSPRCMNCHPAGDVPLQGDESKLHTQNVKRGKDGHGMFASKCSNCHQDQNQPGLNTPPGNPKWSMPPADMKMIFEGRSPHDLAAQLLDPAQNGNKTKEDLMNHITSDTLVLAGWHPAEGKKMPPLSHEEFTAQFKLWLDNGAYLPD